MACIKLNNGMTFELQNNPEESYNGRGYWYLRLDLKCTLSADEIGKIFTKDNLTILTMIDDLEQEITFYGYNDIVSLRRIYVEENITLSYISLNLQKIMKEDA